MQLSRLIQNLPPYHFANAKQKIAASRARGVDVINLSAGDPDLPPDPKVVERLYEAMHELENLRYPEYRGMRLLHEAFAGWFQRRFGVALEPEKEMLPLLGSKEGLAYVAQAVLNPGDISLIPDPYYPVYVTGSTGIGAEPYMLPLLEQNRFLPDLKAIPTPILQKARLLWLNYPNNPTTAIASRTFFEQAVEFAHRHDLVILHDMAYAEVYFDTQERPLSLLEIPGARKVAVELHSMSKTYNMAGFRVGMLVGNAELVDAVGRLKSNIDSGMFRPIQYAAVEALGLPESWILERNEIYKERRDLLIAGCERMGLRVTNSNAGLYLWTTVPEGESSRLFCERLFERTGVFLTPGSNFGDAGEGYARISLTESRERLHEALERIESEVKDSWKKHLSR